MKLLDLPISQLSRILTRSTIKISLIVILFFSATICADGQKKPAKKTPTQKSTTKKPVQKTSTQKPASTKTTAEEKKPASNEAEDEKKVRDMVAFFQYVLNTLGSSETPARDKDVLITESYSKIFRDDKVQVEDDLAEERLVITNKDIVAYLKDVDFFFKDVKFEFTIDAIKKGVTPEGNDFYKVSTTRNLSGITSDGLTVNRNIIRYIEINFDPKAQDLKIESIYTNQLDPKGALVNWWNDLSFEWQSIFKKKLNLQDSLSYNDIKRVTAIQDLDLNSNRYIQNIEPLTQLVSLKLLDLSATNVTDLTPIRNLTELVELNLSNTKIADLSPLRYAAKLVRLNLDYTSVTSIAVVEKMPGLQNLQLSRTGVSDFMPVSNLTQLLNLNVEATKLGNLSALTNLTQLMDLNIGKTFIQDISIARGFSNLVSLNIDSTVVYDLSPLSQLSNLKVLHANYTLIRDLKPLQKLPQLEKIYCDQTPIKRDAADAFMSANKKVLVVFDSKDLKAWWEGLSTDWQQIFMRAAKIGAAPGKDELAKVTNLDSINFSGKGSIKDLEPLRKLPNLRIVIASKTAIADLSGISDQKRIERLDISDTQVNDISLVHDFKNLKELRADRTKIEKLDPAFNLTGLKKLYIDQSTVHDIIAQEFLEKNPDCLLVYKTNHLNRWWGGLSREWKEVFRSQMEKDTSATRENLHKLAERKSLQFKDFGVSDLSVLSEFVRLRELHFSGTAISNVPPLDNLKSLKSLHAISSPIQKIESISLLTELEDLDISNTPVDELRPIGNLQNLRRVNCAGTQIKKLDALERLENLEYLDCSNTKVGSLDAVQHLPLKTLKCYNTKISEREVKNFKERNPDCTVVYYR